MDDYYFQGGSIRQGLTSEYCPVSHRVYSAFRKYSYPLTYSTFCGITAGVSNSFHMKGLVSAGFCLFPFN
jgi:hypothetical protein